MTPRRCARPGRYPCLASAVWALTTVLREDWQFACARHLNQISEAMADQARIELIRADRLDADGGIAVTDMKLAREAISTGALDAWTYGDLKTHIQEASGLNYPVDECKELLKKLLSEGFITHVGGTEWAPAYALSRHFAEAPPAAERPIGYTSNG